jgi:hypothetical protein
VLARGVLSSSEPVLHFGLGASERIKRMEIAWPSGHVQTFSDLGVDRRFIVTESDSLPISTPPQPMVVPQFEECSASSHFALASHEEKVDELVAQPLLPIRQNHRSPSIAIGNLFGRFGRDVILGGTTIDAIRLLAGDASGLFGDASTNAFGPVGQVDDGPILIFDANGDGINDVLITKGGSTLAAGDPAYQPKLFFGNGRGEFSEAPAGTLPSMPFSVGAVAAADFDRDGKLDVFVGARLIPGRYPFAPQSALLANRGGKFEDVTDALAPGLRNIGMVTGALWSDIDGDGWPDLLLTLEWGGVRCFHNNQGKGFEDWTEKLGFAAAGKGWWTSIASADFNGDGRPDYVVGNVGLNTQYRASPDAPALLYAGDFRGDGSIALIEAYHEGGRVYPWRTRQDLGASIPTILRKFHGNDAYARASLNEIVSPASLQAADRFEATELQSGVFLSQPDGTYRFKALPRLAQIAPIQGLVAGDFDGDGRAEIFAVQNLYAPIAPIGPFDGGLGVLLKGNGAGDFEVVPFDQSGLVVPGDAKALAAMDFSGDGWPGFLVTRNNATTLAFRNRGVAGRRSLAISLEGEKGNAEGVGAKISVWRKDGSKQVAEVFAGSGYFSQSSAECYFGSTAENPVVRAEVRWPDGKVSQHELARENRVMLRHL